MDSISEMKIFFGATPKTFPHPDGYPQMAVFLTKPR